MAAGPIIFVEDDEDDKFVMDEILNLLQLPNELKWFSQSKDALNYLLTTDDQPFIILCDINLPDERGLEFKKRIDDSPMLRRKSIPFIFYTTSADPHTINEAYMKLTIQGYFQKPPSFEE